MKHPKSIYYVLSIFCALTISTGISAIVNWNGITITTSVTDDDIILTSTNSIQGGIEVIANTSDVNIVLTGDAILQGDATGPSRLYFETTNSNRVINVFMQHNLTFRGSANGTPLLITISGPGSVIFYLDETTKLLLSADNTHGGAQLFVMMGNPNAGFLQFTRAQNGNYNTEVAIGKDSLMSYLAQGPIGASSEVGFIDFLVDNTGTGRSVLRIEDTGALIISGNNFNGTLPPALLLSDIDMTTPAGLLSLFTVNNDATKTTAYKNLIIINNNQTLGEFMSDPWQTGSFSGVRYGCVLGTNGRITITPNSYLDYVGTATNTCPTPAIPADVLNGRTVEQVVKERNASALLIDGYNSPGAIPATIFSITPAALYFRSGVANDGSVYEVAPDGTFSFTIDPQYKTPGAGNVVLDVEGKLLTIGLTPNQNNVCTQYLSNPSKMEILSLAVTANGGNLLPGVSSNKFNKRTYALNDDNTYQVYNSGYFLINYEMIVQNTTLQHTDENHLVIEKNDTLSEPTYVGGDAPAFGATIPSLNFANASMLINASVALTGLDVFVPTVTLSTNQSAFVFGYNGRKIDNGTGNSMILGTAIGSHACDGITTIDASAFLNVYEKDNVNPQPTQNLYLCVMANDASINQNITTPITNQFAIQSIYLGNNSNILIGTNGAFGTNPNGVPFTLTSQPTILIAGNYFSFGTKGGQAESPETSSVTGQGGIFVNKNGTFTVDTASAIKIRASIDAMVTRSRNGIVNLPQSCVLFDPTVGIATGNLDLTDPSQRIIVGPEESISDYTLFWPFVIKDYNNFIPYEVGSVNAFNCLPVIQENITALPTVQGKVQQFQIKGARLGDGANLMIDGGYIRELVFLPGDESADAPEANLILQNNAYVGLGNDSRNLDSLDGNVMLGMNGITIIANGDGLIFLNQDLIVNNICHILAGPDFGACGTQTLRFDANCCRSLVVKSGGILDLSSLTSSNQVVEFIGQTQLVLEPGALVLLNGGKLIMSDDAQILVGELP